PTSITRTPRCCGSSSPTVARSVPAASPASPSRSSVRSPRRSRTRARWRCCRTRPAVAESGAEQMKLILTHEVSNLGQPGDIVEVKDGYGRNFLLPRNYAIRWTKGAAKQVESIKAAREARAIHDLETAKSVKGTLEAAPINVPAHAGEGGRLFGAVTVS